MKNWKDKRPVFSWVYPSTINVITGKKKANQRFWSVVIWGLILLVAPWFFFGKAGGGPIGDLGIFKIIAPEGTGTGFLISEEYILTAAHVAGPEGTQVQFESTDGSFQGSGTVIASDYNKWQEFKINDNAVAAGATEFDWSLIKIENGTEMKYQPLSIGDPNSLTQGSDIFLFGFPLGGDFIMSKGIVSGITPTEINTDAELDPGFSGGPVISDATAETISQGNVYGISISVPFASKTNKNILRIDVILNKLNKQGIVL